MTPEEVAHACGPDTEHCSCVPHLRAEIERLRAQRILSNEDFARAFDLGLAAGEKRERAAVVTWLREAGHSGALDVEVTGVPVSERERAILRRVVTMALCEAANLVDSGEHRREEER